MTSEKCSPYTPPNPVVTPDIGTPEPVPSRGGDVGFQHGEDRSKRGEDLRPFDETGWWFRITEKTWSKKCHHCQNTDGRA